VALRNKALLAHLAIQLNAGPMFLGREPTGSAPNITTEEREFMSTSFLKSCYRHS
jgi:hypothetical protein